MCVAFPVWLCVCPGGNDIAIVAVMNFPFSIQCSFNEGFYMEDRVPETSLRDGEVGVTKWNNVRWNVHKIRRTTRRSSLFSVLLLFTQFPSLFGFSTIYSIVDTAATRTRAAKGEGKRDKNDLCFRCVDETLMFVRCRRALACADIRFQLPASTRIAEPSLCIATKSCVTKPICCMLICNCQKSSLKAHSTEHAAQCTKCRRKTRAKHWKNPTYTNSPASTSRQPLNGEVSFQFFALFIIFIFPFRFRHWIESAALPIFSTFLLRQFDRRNSMSLCLWSPAINTIIFMFSEDEIIIICFSLVLRFLFIQPVIDVRMRVNTELLENRAKLSQSIFQFDKIAYRISGELCSFFIFQIQLFCLFWLRGIDFDGPNTYSQCALDKR